MILVDPSNLAALLGLIDVSHSAYRRIALLIIWSILYNTAALACAVGAFADKVKIKPEWAGLGGLIGIVPVLGVVFGWKGLSLVWIVGLGWRGREKGVVEWVCEVWGSLVGK